jgi:histidine triad (HIT) family protein
MKNEDCIFCKIIEGKIPSQKVFENESVIGIVDLAPQAAKHYLFIHRDHTKDVNVIADTHSSQLADIFKSISEYTKKSGLADTGFRVVTNQGAHGGQTVFHTHFHLVGGEQLRGFGR